MPQNCFEMPLKLSIIIPVFNEEKTIHLILDKILQVKLINGLAKEMVIVNDCSTDGTVDEVKRYIASHRMKVSFFLTK